MPTIYNPDDLLSLPTFETQVLSYLNQSLSKIFKKKSPEVYFSSRLLSRSSFPQLFAKQEDGTLGLKESRLFEHFYHKSNLYHHFPSVSLKDRPRHLKLHLFDNQLLSSATTKLKLITDANDRVELTFASDFAFVTITNQTDLKPILS